jgi:hypothetical protein
MEAELQIVEEILENAIEGYPHICLKIFIYTCKDLIIVSPLLFDMTNKLLSDSIQQTHAKKLLAQSITLELELRNI